MNSHTKSLNIFTKKVNGKWRYYYDVGPAGFKIGNSGRSGMDGEPDSNIQGYSKIEDLLGKDEKDRYWRLEREARRMEENEKRNAPSNYTYRPEDREKTLQAQRKVVEAWNEYKRTPFGKITQATEVINKGRDAVANMLDKLSSELRDYRKTGY